MIDVPTRTAARAAFAAAGLNLLAALAMLVLLQPGLPVEGSDLEGRWTFVRERSGLWWAGWLTWHAAALALLAFYLGLASRWQRRAPVRSALAVLCATAGLAADLLAQTLYMGLGPVVGRETFAVLELAAGAITGYLGNGLYTLAGILLTWAGAHELPRPLVALSVVPWTAGLALSAASLAHSAVGQFWSTAVLMPSFVGWALLVGLWLARQARSSDG